MRTYPVHSVQCRVCGPFLASGQLSVCRGVLLYLPARSSFFILDVFKVVLGQVQHKRQYVPFSVERILICTFL